MEKYNRISTLVLFGLLSGCNAVAPFQSDLSAWEGHTLGELTDSWGEPDRTTAIGPDTNALTWVDQGIGCEYTFIAHEKIITGYSETQC